LSMQKQMLASHTKILERYVRDGQHDKIAEWQMKVDKLRQQIEEIEGPSMQQSYQPSQQYNQPGGYNQAPTGGPNQRPYTQNPSQPPYGNQPPPQQGYPQGSNYPSGPQGNQPPPQQQGYQQGSSYSSGQQAYQPSQPVQPAVPHVTATEKRAQEILSETNLKLQIELDKKETIITSKSEEVDRLNLHIKGLSEQLQGVKSSNMDRISHLEREFALLKTDFEDVKLSKQRELEQQRMTMQREIDQSAKIIQEKDSNVTNLSSQLTKIKNDQEEEQVKLGTFVGKAVGSLKMANQCCQETGGFGSLCVESSAKLGFSTLTIKSVINGRT